VRCEPDEGHQKVFFRTSSHAFLISTAAAADRSRGLDARLRQYASVAEPMARPSASSCFGPGSPCGGRPDDNSRARFVMLEGAMSQETLRSSCSCCFPLCAGRNFLVNAFSQTWMQGLHQQTHNGLRTIHNPKP
jgi:hypothetical protein